MGRSIAIMQPYLFPYLGYFQLVDAVNIFVFYDDVNFIKGGWIDRNYILVNQQPFLFSVPLSKMSSFKKINETRIHSNQYGIWKKKFFKTLEQNYNSAPYFDEVYPIIEKTLNSGNDTISGLAIKSIKLVADYLELKTEFVMSSNINNDKKRPAAERLIEMCRIEDAKEYINLYGGKDLYNKKYFCKRDIRLQFLKPAEINYRPYFKTPLSIIDVMMVNSVEEIKNLIKLYSLH